MASRATPEYALHHPQAFVGCSSLLPTHLSPRSPIGPQQEAHRQNSPCSLVCAGAVCKVAGGGMVLVLGAAAMFADEWLDKDDNSKLMEAIFKWCRPVSLACSYSTPDAALSCATVSGYCLAV